MPHLADQKTLHLQIHGRVQGVYFRQSMLQEAQRLGVNGWVRNRNDGSVEAVVQGDAEAVDMMVRWAQHGPTRAKVERVDSESAAGSFANFEVTD
jgi:acylphosphatase